MRSRQIAVQHGPEPAAHVLQCVSATRLAQGKVWMRVGQGSEKMHRPAETESVDIMAETLMVGRPKSATDPDEMHAGFRPTQKARRDPMDSLAREAISLDQPVSHDPGAGSNAISAPARYAS